ncbi:hypothetical protein C5142_03935 [Rhodococcus sp. BGS-1C]|jgi:hypothetical protein|uniref:hypothetical protein n=1 Tax=Nocardiaceae TaxID=85025 RepID=UPI0009685020|nr:MULTISPECIES: hypothetical protein [Rhodococcus]MCZ4275201.1 hypothetical protein [Rhodococcus yunnanensis]OLT33392.1 hypothetical protein BJF84_22620 [Rhodococcus sp. CUA-806]
MTFITLLLLVLSAAAAVVPSRQSIPHWVNAAVSAALLALAAITGAMTDPAQGFALAATYVVTVSAAVVGGSAIVTAVFRIARRDGAPEPGGPAGPASAGPLHGGKTIGALERTAVAVSILAGWPEGIAIVLAVKGLARYPELRGTDPPTETPTTQVSSASEQFIIGTFASVMWAVAVCGIGLGLVS